MSFYRIYKYPYGDLAYKHIYFKRDRFNGRERQHSFEIQKELENIQRFDNNLARVRRTVRDLILCNKFDYFCTFTFSPQKVDRYDLKTVKQKITKLFAHYKERYSSDFKYLLVPEQHKDGAWHFHGMISGIRAGDFTTPATVWKHPYKGSDELIEVPNTKGYVDWTYYSSKLGHFNCSLVRHYDSCATYVSKYITKDMANAPRGQQLVLASKKLNRPELVFDCDGIPMLFDASFKDDFVEMAWVSSGKTVGTYILSDEDREAALQFYEDVEAVSIFVPLVGEQLKL